jgi:hypothetical protein
MSPNAMYRALVRIQEASRSESAKKSAIMENVASHTSVTFSRNGIVALANASESGSPAARRPRNRKRICATAKPTPTKTSDHDVKPLSTTSHVAAAAATTNATHQAPAQRE